MQLEKEMTDKHEEQHTRKAHEVEVGFIGESSESESQSEFWGCVCGCLKAKKYTM